MAKELWRIKVKCWGPCYVVAKEREAAVEKARKHIFKILDEDDEEFVVTSMELIDSDVFT